MKEVTVESIKAKLEKNHVLKDKLDAFIMELTKGKKITETQAKEILKNNPELSKKFDSLTKELSGSLELSLEELEEINGGAKAIRLLGGIILGGLHFSKNGGRVG